MQTDAIDHRSYQRNRTATQKHDQQAKMLALSVYAETLSTTEASKRSGVPKTTIHTWVHEPDSDALLDQLRTAMRSQLAFRCAEAAVLAVDTVLDRLKHGEYRLINNELQLCPVNAKDAGYLAGMMIDRHTLLTSGNNGNKVGDALTLVAGKLMEAIQTAAQSPKKEAKQGDAPVDNSK